MGKQKEKKKDHASAGRATENTDKRSVDDTDDARGGGSNQNRDKGGVELDSTGGRRAKHNDDADKYGGRGGGNRGKGA